MSKVTITFDSYEEQEELDCALNGVKYKNQVDEMWQKLFRPRNKHGYNNQRLNELLCLCSDSIEETQSQKDCNELMDLLEELYREVLNDE
jgi:hypothetical protein